METMLSRAQIPIIDLSHLGDADFGADDLEKFTRSSLKRVATHLNKSLAQTGLAFLVNHGIPEERLIAAYAALDRFCELPSTTRELYLRHSPDNHGYVPPGVERFSKEPADEVRHTFNVSSLEKCLPEEEIPGFRAIVTSLSYDFRRLASLLLRVIAAGFELPTEYLFEMHKNMLGSDNSSCLRLIYYPPWNPEIKEDALRCGEHTDYGSFTLLTQDSEGGLEIKTKGGDWMRVGHLPGAILINTGELLSYWTNGQYRAIPHRVVMPDEQSVRSHSRHSAVFFVHPDDKTPLTPLPSPFIKLKDDEDTEELVQTAYEFLQARLKETYLS